MDNLKRLYATTVNGGTMETYGSMLLDMERVASKEREAATFEYKSITMDEYLSNHLCGLLKPSSSSYGSPHALSILGMRELLLLAERASIPAVFYEKIYNLLDDYLYYNAAIELHSHPDSAKEMSTLQHDDFICCEYIMYVAECLVNGDLLWYITQIEKRLLELYDSSQSLSSFIMMNGLRITCPSKGCDLETRHGKIVSLSYVYTKLIKAYYDSIEAYKTFACMRVVDIISYAESNKGVVQKEDDELDAQRKDTLLSLGACNCGGRSFIKDEENAIQEYERTSEEEWCDRCGY